MFIIIIIIIVSSQAYTVSLKSEILPVTTFSLSTGYHEILTMTNSLPMATKIADGNNTTAVTVLVNSVIGAVLIVVMTITTTILCIIIRKRKTTEGMY